MKRLLSLTLATLALSLPTPAQAVWCTGQQILPAPSTRMLVGRWDEDGRRIYLGVTERVIGRRCSDGSDTFDKLVLSMAGDRGAAQRIYGMRFNPYPVGGVNVGERYVTYPGPPVEVKLARHRYAAGRGDRCAGGSGELDRRPLAPDKSFVVPARCQP